VIESNELTFTTRIAEVGGCADESRFDEVIEAAMRECDSVGGVVECRVDNVAVGLGEPFFDSVESSIAHLLFAIPAVKGVEFGAGFEVARRRGSENNDLIINGDGATATNNDGGINGGITNGNQLVVRVAVKPTASIARAQMTYDFEQNQITELQIKGRHDACIALRAAVVVESAVAIALADLWLRHRSRD
jgi:chorismate synthase